ncbi:MAG TPA: hypothetical protein VF524_15840 [Polyangia bacterium]
MNSEPARSASVRKSTSSSWLRVREARESDVPAMTELLAILFKQEADFQPDAGKQQRALGLLMAQPALGRAV